MRLIIAGSREVPFKVALPMIELVCRRLKPSVVVSGTARGVDSYGEHWARRNKVPIDPYPAAWRDKFGRKDNAAGHKRNAVMGENADALLVIMYEDSRGSAGMLQVARRRKLPIVRIVLRKDHKIKAWSVENFSNN